MRVHVDKAGRHYLAGDVDLMRARRLRHVFSAEADRGDAITGNGDVGTKPLPPGTVDDLAAAQDVIGHARPTRSGCYLIKTIRSRGLPGANKATHHRWCNFFGLVLNVSVAVLQRFEHNRRAGIDEG